MEGQEEKHNWTLDIQSLQEREVELAEELELDWGQSRVWQEPSALEVF